MVDDNDVMQPRARVLDLEGKVNFLYKHLNIQYIKELSETEKKVVEAVRKGNVLDGIRIYHEVYRVDLESAKKAVEELLK